ncbi:hypothetical protein AB0B89_03480 [Sphaerisporangium sp. NPDC049002]|uniref:hypothetical protein n=1 Tax=unclassified Sphaerisporangium TaxID=2630420 RepID=UPI0034052BB2
MPRERSSQVMSVVPRLRWVVTVGVKPRLRSALVVREVLRSMWVTTGSGASGPRWGWDVWDVLGSVEGGLPGVVPGGKGGGWRGFGCWILLG